MADPKQKPVATADAEIGRIRYAVSIHTGAHTLTADETAHEGGADAGPSPFGLVLSGLGACTAITLRMYAERKSWPLEAVHVHLASVGKARARRGRLTSSARSSSMARSTPSSGRGVRR